MSHHRPHRPPTSARLALGIFLLAALGTAGATPIQPTFSSCLSSYSPVASAGAQLDISGVYADLLDASTAIGLGLAGSKSGVHNVLRVNLIGNAAGTVEGYNNATNKLATLFSSTSTASVNIWSTASWLCNSIYPAPLPSAYSPNDTFCPIPAGPFGLNLTIPLYRSYALTTLTTQVRIVDTSASANTLACVHVNFTPYRKGNWPYELFLWLPVSIAIGFWVVQWAARFAAGWVVGRGVAEYGTKEQRASASRNEGNTRDAKARKWGTMIVSGLSGERLSVSGGLLRFVTPGVTEIFHHIQFVTILSMIAVNWPRFAYPIITRGAWADLVWNTTLVQPASTKISVSPTNGTVPSAFTNFFSDASFPLYLPSNTPNPLLDLHGSNNGLESFATMVGLRPEDLFGTCLVLFLILAGVIGIISILFWFIHSFVELCTMETKSTNKRSSYMSSPEASRASLGGKEVYESGRAEKKERGRFRKTWYRFRPKGEAGAFHAAALYGNLLRLILIFHLPVTTFSIYQLCLSSSSIVSRVFAALAFVFISIAIPAGVLWKISRTPSGKLYDATRTLLALGPMYNVYVEEKQMFRVFPLSASLVTGIVVGAGQQSGLAQAIVLVMVELAMLIIPAVWYPWGEGASMGAPHTFLGIIRVTSALLVLILSPPLGIDGAVADWLAYAVLLLQTIAFAFFLFMLLTKIVEGCIRLSGGVPFDESNHPLDGGLFATIMDLDCFNPITGGKAAARKRRKRGSRQLQRNVNAAGSLSTQMMLDRHSMGVPRPPPAKSPGSTPFLSPTGEFGGNYMRDGYFSPASPPPLGPPPTHDRHSSEFGHDESSHGGHIMDAWRPHPVGYAAPGTYAPQVGSPGPGGAAVGGNGYEYGAHSPNSGGDRTLLNTPSSSRTPGMRANKVGALPAPLEIPRRRSLNDMKNRDPSPGSEYSSGTPKKGKGRGWFVRNQNDESPSESEEEITPRGDRRTASGVPGRGRGRDRSSAQKTVPRKASQLGAGAGTQLGAGAGTNDGGRPDWMVEPLPFQPVPVSPAESTAPRGWRQVLGLTRNKRGGEEDEAARDENKARKAALAAASGALFAGVEEKPKDQKTFRVNRKSGAPSGGTTPTSPRGAARRISGIRSPTSPTGGGGLWGLAPGAGLSAVAARDGASTTPEPGAERSFKVKRMGQRPMAITPSDAPASTRTSPNMSTNARLPNAPDVPVPLAAARALQGTGDEGVEQRKRQNRASWAESTTRAIMESPTASEHGFRWPTPTVQEGTEPTGNGDGERSFKVKRQNTYDPPRSPERLPFHPSPPPTLPRNSLPPPRASPTDGSAPVRSFKVKRPNTYHPPSRGSSRPTSQVLATTVPAPASPTFGTAPAPAAKVGQSEPTTGYNSLDPSPPKTPPPLPAGAGAPAGGYSPSAFIPMHNTPSPPLGVGTPPSPPIHTRAAIEEKRWDYPARPARDPRRSSEDARRGSNT